MLKLYVNGVEVGSETTVFDGSGGVTSRSRGIEIGAALGGTRYHGVDLTNVSYVNVGEVHLGNLLMR